MGASRELALQLSDAGADNGSFLLTFNDAACTLSEETDAQGNQFALAICGYGAQMDEPDGKKLDALRADLERRSIAAVPVMAEGENALGFLSRFDLEGAAEGNFIAWMNFLAKTCTFEGNNAQPGDSDKGNAGLCRLFEKCGIELDGKYNQNAWTFAFPDCMVALECDLSSGHARLSSQVAQRDLTFEQMKNIIGFNAALQASGFLTFLGSSIWYCTPVLIYEDIDAVADDYLSNLFADHIARTKNCRAAIEDILQGREAGEGDDPVNAYANYLQV